MQTETLEQRVAALEHEVRELRMRMPGGPAAASVDHGSETPAVEQRRAALETAPASDWATGIIAKIGIGLVLFGVAYLLKFSYDQGWLSEAVRVALGFAAGTALLAGGLHQRRVNETLSAVLLGGSIATLYGSNFAAYSLYDLVPWSVGMAGMVGTTMLGFALAVTQDRSALATIAAAGGLAAPFLLHKPDGGPELLALYTIVLLAGMSAIYLMRGWRSLLVMGGFGGLCVMTAASLGAEGAGAFAQLLVAAGILGSVGAAAIVPALRSMLRGATSGAVELTMAVVTPMAAVGVFDLLVQGSTPMVAGAVLGMAVIFGTLHAVANDEMSFVTAVTLAVVAVATLAGVEPLAAALLGLVVAANTVAASGHDGVRFPGYLALGAAGLWTFALLFDSPVGTPFFNPVGLHMVLATLALVLVGRTHADAGARWTNFYAATAAGLVTVVHQLGTTPGGEALATVLWGVLALGALVLGLTKDHRRLLVLGIAVMLSTAVKLLAFDLNAVATIWRVGLLLGFGSAMLYIAYRLPIWQQRPAR